MSAVTQVPRLEHGVTHAPSDWGSGDGDVHPSVGARVRIGVLLTVVVFGAFLFFVSGVTQARAQRLLFQRFSAELPTGQMGALDQPVPLGSPVALLVIPSIHESQVVIEGSTSSDLMEGPGHVASTPLPGEFGDSIVLGRGSTYGAPFRSLDSLKEGDEIDVTTGQGAFRYVVSTILPVSAQGSGPVPPATDSRLTLITTTSVFSPSSRVAVTAILDGDPIGVATRPATTLGAGDLSAGWDGSGFALALVWGAILFAVVKLGIKVYRKWPPGAAYLVVGPTVVFLLWQVFTGLARALPGTT